MMKRKSKAGLVVGALILAVLGLFMACGSGGDGVIISSRAYKGHENDVDINNLCRAYTSIVGTRLDDCHSCHMGEMEGDTQVGNACDYCHMLMIDETGHTFDETLNAFGADYNEAGKSISAIVGIRWDDSDGWDGKWMNARSCI